MPVHRRSNARIQNANTRKQYVGDVRMQTHDATAAAEKAAPERWSDVIEKSKGESRKDVDELMRVASLALSNLKKCIEDSNNPPVECQNPRDIARDAKNNMVSFKYSALDDKSTKSLYSMIGDLQKMEDDSNLPKMVVGADMMRDAIQESKKESSRNVAELMKVASVALDDLKQCIVKNESDPLVACQYTRERVRDVKNDMVMSNYNAIDDTSKNSLFDMIAELQDIEDATNLPKHMEPLKLSAPAPSLKSALNQIPGTVNNTRAQSESDRKLDGLLANAQNALASVQNCIANSNSSKPKCTVDSLTRAMQAIIEHDAGKFAISVPNADTKIGIKCRCMCHPNKNTPGARQTQTFIANQQQQTVQTHQRDNHRYLDRYLAIPDDNNLTFLSAMAPGPRYTRQDDLTALVSRLHWP